LQAGCATELKEYLYIVTDFLPYTINDLNVNPSPYECDLEQANNFCLESIKQVMFGLFRGLADLHSIGITHRDIKLSNILIDNNKFPVQQIKICDLGSSKKLKSDPADESTQSISYIGTRSFRAPELLVGNKYYDTKIDIWSAGIVFLKLVLIHVNNSANIFDVKDTKQLCKVITEYLGEPTRVELDEMMAQNKILSTSIKAGLSDDQILKKRFKKLDSLVKHRISPEALDLLH